MSERNVVICFKISIFALSDTTVDKYNDKDKRCDLL